MSWQTKFVNDERSLSMTNEVRQRRTKFVNIEKSILRRLTNYVVKKICIKTLYNKDYLNPVIFYVWTTRTKKEFPYENIST